MMGRNASLAIAILTMAVGAALAAPKPPIGDEAARKIILDNRSRWKDPDSIKGAKIGQTHACTTPTFPGKPGNVVYVPASCMCLELNAKNSYGGYTGSTPVIVVFVDGKFHTIRTGNADSGFEKYCVNMNSFPEMNGRSEAGQPLR